MQKIARILGIAFIISYSMTVGLMVTVIAQSFCVSPVAPALLIDSLSDTHIDTIAHFAYAPIAHTCASPYKSRFLPGVWASGVSNIYYASVDVADRAVDRPDGL